MSNTLLGRSNKVPAGYNGDVRQNKVIFDKLYIGFVKENKDAMRMGRLKVWIPELSGDPHEPTRWFTVRYMSPFAGASPIGAFKGQKTPDATQHSYGWWGVVPDLENEVVIAFANGDPGRGILVGCLYQEYMNHMVPGVAAGQSFQTDNTMGVEPPVMEYNKWGDSKDVATPDPVRPRFEPLHRGLMAEGLYTDPLRGPSQASARNVDKDNTPARCYGFLSPKGNQWYINEEENDEYIRIRTKGGAQVLVNETLGFIYINSKNGNSWIEISDQGIDVYSRQNISMRAQRDINIRADQDVNIEGGQSVNIRSVSGPIRLHAKGGNLEAKSERGINLHAAGQGNFLTGSSLQVSAGGMMSLKSGGPMFHNAPTIRQNSGSGGDASAASVPAETAQPDTILNPPSFPQGSTNTILSRMPAHEPWAKHNKVTTGGQQGESSNVREGSAGSVRGHGKAGHSGDPSTNKGDPKSPVGKASPFKGDPSKLGYLSGKYESNGNPGSVGWDSTGGYSYGSYQIAANTGTMDNYMEYLKKNNPEQYEKLQAAGGAEAAKRGDPKFQATWKEMAKNDPAFAESQHDFIKATHYDKAADRLDGSGLDVNNRSKALQDVVWSTSVQHGPGGTQKIFDRAMDGKDPSTMSDEEIIKAVYAERSKTDVYFKSSTPAVKASVEQRYAREQQDALAMLKSDTQYAANSSGAKAG